jgi:DNA repair protein RecO (recombination protein O)
MSVLVQANGIVLHRLRHGETSLILNVFTREFGKIGLLAKGARGKSKLASSAGLELFNEAQFVFYRKATRDLQLLKEWVLLAAHSPLREDLDRMTVGSAIMELLARCLHEEDPHPELYDSSVAALQALDGRPAHPLPLLWAFELQLFRVLGFALQLEVCAISGRPLVPPFEREIRYRLSDGSFVHPSVPSDATFAGGLSPEAFAALVALIHLPPEFAGKMALGLRANREIATFLTRYLETHLPIKGRLRSLTALTWGTPPSES